MKPIDTYIQETRLTKKNIELVKQFLIEYKGVNNWKEYVDCLKESECKKICEEIKRHFPKLFDRMYTDIFVDYSDIAKRKINDNKEMFGNHYVLTKHGKMYDFGRGANCVNGIYVMTQKEDNSDKYEITFTEAEKSLIYDQISHI